MGFSKASILKWFAVLFSSLLKKVKEENEKAGLKLNLQKLRLWHPVPSLTSWQVDREAMETVTDFIFFGSKITADGD